MSNVIMKRYYLTRTAQHQRYRADSCAMQGAENIGPFETWEGCRLEQQRLNAQVVKPQRKRGRPAKASVRFEMKLDAELHKRLTASAAQTGESLTTVVERVLTEALPTCDV